MPEDEGELYSEDSPLSVVPVRFWPYRDGALESLLFALEETGGEWSLTVLVSGHWITGQAVGPRHWFEQVAADIDARTSDNWGLVFRSMGQRTYPSDSEVEADPELRKAPDAPHRFLHLREARVLPNVLGLDRGQLMRIRLDQIGAWMSGMVAPAGQAVPPPPDLSK